MKTKLTKDDPSGWWVCQRIDTGREIAFKTPDDGLYAEQYTNFRRLIIAEPEIIEGDGVTVLPKGTYWLQLKDDAICVMSHLSGAYVTNRGSRYIRIPDPQFPPREEPDPPKPELVLVKIGGKKHWAMKHGMGYRLAICGSWFMDHECEVVKGAKA